MRIKTFAIGGLLTVAAGASAQIVATGAFTGVNSEGFEEFQNYAVTGSVGSLSILQGTATISDTTAVSPPQLYVYSPTTTGAHFGLGLNGMATVHGGLNGLSLWGFANAVNVTLTFNQAVDGFGGYFADNSSFVGSLTFWDSSDTQIGVTNIDHSGNSMEWFGWTSKDLIKSITFTDDPVNGMIAMDDLQAGIRPTPEPGTFAVLGLGALGLLVRRKKR